MDINEIAEKLNRIKVKKESVSEILNVRIKRKEEIKQELETLLKSQSLLQQVASEVQSQLSVKIDSIVNLGLATCFGDEYKFRLQYVAARGKTEVEFVLLMDNEPVDPMNQNGGGLLDLICFCLRVAIYNISRTNNVMVFDEPMKYLSKSFRSKVAELLHTLSERLGLQFIMVTHIEEFMDYADEKIVVKKTQNVSNVD